MRLNKAPSDLALTVVLRLSLLVFFLFFSFLPSLCVPPSVQAAPEPNFSAERAYDHVKYLVQKIGPRPAGSKAELKAAQYIYYTLEQSGWKVREQPFSKVVVHDPPLQMGEAKVELVSSQNIIAELPGKKADTVVLGAHYDSADANAPGALDNASGVGVLLELARVLAAGPHEETYQMVFFGAEEMGLVGSSYYTSQADLSAVNWMLNLDMVGSPLEIDVAGKKSAPPELVEKITELARENKIPFSVSRDAILMNRDAPQGGDSDFASFLEQGIPAAGLGISGRPAGFFHRPEDRIERISLVELQKVGDFVEQLARTVRLTRSGSRTWDDFYITFQLGAYVFVLPSLGLRLLYLLVFLWSAWGAARSIRHAPVRRWRRYLVLTGVVFLTCLAIVATSGAGEFLWQFVKQRELVWYAHPGWFLLARLGIASGLILFLTSWFPRLPLPREPRVYWLAATGALSIASLLMAFVRIDLAFPFVFWLFFLNIQRIWPNPFLALAGPYFFYRFHWELLNSNQWQSYYQEMHKHALLFIVFYSLLIIPLLLSLLHAASAKPHFWAHWLARLRRPSLLFMVLSVLLLGAVPSYTARFPQDLTLREVWKGEDLGHLVVASPDKLPGQLVQELHIAPGRRAVLPSLRQEPPVVVQAEVAERAGLQNKERSVDLGLQFKYARDPYLVKITLQSDRPFKITAIDEFLPLNKLPRKVQLSGRRRSQGDYALTLERTPPQRNLVKMSLVAESTLKCTVEVTFPDLDQSLSIHAKDLSVKYEAIYQKTLQF